MPFDRKIQAIEECLKRFEPIDLEDLSEILMDRRDRKFLLHKEKVEDLVCGLENEYRVLRVNDNLIHEYETLYLDTDSYSLYRSHHNGKANRFKLRFRKYGNSGVSFFEIKFKNNKSRTIKTRIPCEEVGLPLTETAKRLIHEETGIDPDALKPRVNVSYRRITLIGPHDEERITIDTDIEVEHEGRDAGFGDLAIVEVKQDQWRTTPMISQLRELHISRGRMSKYCLALCKLEPSLRQNNFKPNLRKIQKIIHEANAT